MPEGVDGFERAPGIFMVWLVELEGVSGGLVVNAKEN
jgi:hypothetical protein